MGNRRIQRTRRRTTFTGRLVHALRERQIYVRSDGDIQYITLSPAGQVLGLVFVLAGLFWMAYATINIAFKDKLLLIKEQRMYQARLDYEDRVAELRKSIDALNGKLLLDQEGYLAKVDEVKAEYGKLVRQHERLSGFFRRGFMPLKDSGEAPLPAAPPGKTGLNDEPLATKYAAQFASTADVLRPLQDVRRQFAGFESLQVELLAEAKVMAEAKTAGAARMFRVLGIDHAAVLIRSSHEPESTGGPFVAALAAQIESDRVLKAMGDVSEGFAAREKLLHAAAALPIFAPMRKIEKISSAFGLRSDPFRRTAAMHAGVDFKGPWAEPVVATADGVVKLAGYQGAYGNLVEIAHDNGVSTRYGHLGSVSVTAGQRVKRGEVVGRMGNTGRSTGPHLHYETRVAGQPIDPVRFWRIRDDLQAIQEEDER